MLFPFTEHVATNSSLLVQVSSPSLLFSVTVIVCSFGYDKETEVSDNVKDGFDLIVSKLHAPVTSALLF